VPVELCLDGVIWGLANGEVRIPLRGEDDAIAWFMARVREMASERTDIPNMEYLGFAMDFGVLLVTGVTAENRSAVEAIVVRAAPASPP
jgi:acylphosphatase